MKKLIVFTLSMLFIGCEEKKLEPFSSYGGGYFASSGLYFIDFTDKSQKVIEGFSDYYVESLEAFNRDKIIISTDDFNSGYESRRIFNYNLNSAEKVFFNYGSNPTLISNKIIYYNSDSKLVLADFDGMLKNKKIIDDKRSLYRYKVVPISDNEFVYKKNDVFVKYNIDKGGESLLNGLNKCSLGNMKWIELKKKILCAEKIENEFTNDYVLIDIDGKIYDRISFSNKTVWAVSYIEELKVIVFQERTGSIFSGEKHNLLAYDINNGSMKMILNDLYAPNFIFSERK